MIVIGITGPIGHGKSTLARAFASHESQVTLLDASQVITEVVNAWQQNLSQAIPDPDDLTAINKWLEKLPPILKEVTHDEMISIDKLRLTPKAVAADPDNYSKLFSYLTQLQASPGMATTPITTDNKSEYRAILQWLGGYLVEVGDGGIWWREIVRRFKDAQEQDSNLAVTTGLRYPSDATILRAMPATIIGVCRPDVAVTDSTDPTERERQKIVVDSTVYNDGSLEQLERTAHKILQDIRQGSLRPEYYASQSANAN